MSSTDTSQQAITRLQTHIDWQSVVDDRVGLLHALGRANGVRFTDIEAISLVAITVERDIEAAKRQLETMVRPRTEPREVQRGTITAVGLIQLPYPGGRRLLLRRDDEAWIVPDEPNGWERREPWHGDINSVRWIGGPPAVAAFRRVGAPI